MVIKDVFIKIRNFFFTAEEEKHEIECAFCGKPCNFFGHKCCYCHKYFCENHVFPAEKHNCKGKLKNPGGFREFHNHGKITAVGK